ncbi:MAG: CHAT domain-containing protein [Novosphingobium meiothermophilum]|uniref:CHAT domain-containing tetratricopeptide repeat protein n=1 Tax=Novosphingobium meiothermophilum TaxID=2202251 RepID=UPI0011AB453D|nr:CHAT domain-containing protein [Novosphingobium meiothermophilum]
MQTPTQRMNAGAAAALRGAALACGALWLAALAPAAMAQPSAGPTAAQRARLDAMFAAADALDEGADPAAYRRAFEGVLAYGRTLYPPGHPELAWLESEQATADYLQGDIKGAEARLARIAPVLERAITERADEPQWRERRMLVANAQVVIYLTLSQFDKATELGEQVLAWRLEQARRQPENARASTELSAAWSNLANAQIRNGETARAITSVREAIAIDRRLKPIPVNAAPHFGNLVTFLYAAGRLEEAAEEGRRTQAMLESFLPERHPFLAVNLNTLARVLADLGRLDEAEAVARKGLDMAHASFGESQQTLSYLATLAHVLTLNGKAAEAEVLARAATEKMARDLGAEADRALLAREALAGALLAGGKAEDAFDQFSVVSAIRAQRYPPHHRERIEGEDRLALAALEAGDVATAREVQQRAQGLRLNSGAADDTAALVGEARLAALAVLAGDSAAGLDQARAVAARLDTRLGELEAGGARRSGLDRQLRSGFGWAMEAAALAGDAAQAFVLAQPVVEGAAGITARAAARRMAALDPEKAALLRERQDAALMLQTLLDRQLRLAGLGASADRLAALEAERTAATQRFAAADAALAERAPELARSEATERVTLAEAQALLGRDEALLIVAPGPQGLVIIAATGKDAAVVRHGSSRRAAALVRQLRAGLERPGGFDHAASAELRALVLPDAIARVIGKRRRVLVSAGGAFSSLPLAVLAAGTPERPRWLIEDHALVTLPSLGLLRQSASAKPPARPRAFLALGAPQLQADEAADEPAGAGVQLAAAEALPPFRTADNARRLADLPPLPAAADELAGLGKALGARRSLVLTGAQATEAALRGADLSEVDVLALSTHGLVAGELDGLDEPALVLTPAGDEGDGLLTMDEIMDLRLGGAWVVLSACNSAAGSGADGSGLAGLARAFLHAGAGNLLVSHWAVRDDLAARLSTATLARYARGADPAAALQAAMLAMAGGKDTALRDPALWAPFVFVGR